jgi:ribosome-binding protein aMBF1 (putative translation factor)
MSDRKGGEESMSDCDICGIATGVLRRDLMLTQAILCLCKKCDRDYKEEEAEAITFYEQEILSNYYEDKGKGEVYDGYDT